MSSKTKLLDLDAFVPATKIVKIDGHEHKMREMNVEDYIAKVKADQERRATEIDADKPMSAAEAIEKTVEMVVEAFPTIPVERLRSMSLQHLDTLLAFVIKAPEEIEREAATGNA
jgi:hypothetical protein